MGATGVGRGRTRAGSGAAPTAAFVVTVSLFISLPGARTANAAGPWVPGIDVSRWQGDVDWAEVATTPVRYVIMRSTVGNSPTEARFIDPKYFEYLAGATANGLIVGAYHRAHVGLAPNDAVNEANYFVDNSQIQAGDVLPVLDIEQTHGLNVQQMQDWVRAWVARVRTRTGVRPLIYSSPYFWRTSMGDTAWFANHGYPLWIAHWGVAEPNVPAQSWGGRGWTFWQWTSTGSVPGIPADVDRDRFPGSSLLQGRIASLTVVPQLGGTVTGPRIDCAVAAGTCARLANPDTVVTLTARPDPGATVLRWTGACAGAGAAPTCDVTLVGAKKASAVFGYPVQVDREGTGDGSVTSAPASLQCAPTCSATFRAGTTVTLSADPDSASSFTGWGGACAGTDPECAVTVSGPTEVTATFASLVSVEPDGAGTRLRWGRANHAVALGGSYRWERRSGATTSFAFSGGAVTLFTVKGPAMGRGRISIDGAPITTFDGYAPTMRSARLRLTELGSGPHTIEIEVLGTKRPAATGTRVAVDALRSGGVTAFDPAPSAASWSFVAHGAASGGTYAISDVPDASASLRFSGTGASLRARRGPAMGRAAVWVDGSLVKTLDLYAATSGFVTVPLVSGLPDGIHAVRIVVLGTHRAASAGNGVAVDRWIVS